MSVHPDGRVEVVLPDRASVEDAESAVVELGGWIARRRAAAVAAQARAAPPPGAVFYLGRTLTLVPESGRERVHGRGDNLLVPADPVARTPAIERWYRRRARAEIAPRLDAATATLGRGYSKLTIRNQRTRWGSCSTTGAMSFNWRLLLAPEEVLDYVVWHEACHLVHHDHSHRYWGLLERHVPGYREPRRWLRLNGSALVLPA